jgi:hypothetical protein
VTAAVLAAWLDAHVLTHPVAPALAALAAALLIAALPRIGWVVLTVVAIMALSLEDRAGAALLVAIAAIAPIVTQPRNGTDWPLPAGAPMLAALNLAGAWPALAGRAGTVWRRVALAASGWLWLLVAAPLANSDLYIRRPQSATWLSSLSATVHHIVAPAAHQLPVAAVWAAAAALVPWITRPRSLPVNLVLATVWAATTASATITLVGQRIAPAAAPLGAVAATFIVLAPAARQAWRNQLARRTLRPDLRSMELR